MKGIKCQLCDGLILNGRCKTCGMPYRNDEVLYHLNESRHDHYKHATPKAQEMMRQSTIPLGDKRTSYNRSYQNRNSVGRNVSNSNVQNRNAGAGTAAAQASDRFLSKDQIKAQQEKVRQEAMAKINATKMPNRNVNTNAKTKRKGLAWYWVVLIVLYIILGNILR